MHASRKRALGLTPSNSMAGMMAVMGLLERHHEKGKSTIRLRTLEGPGKKHLQAAVREEVEAGTTVNTDALLSYHGLARDFAHNVIDHAEKDVEGNVHTNGLESFWSLLKRAIGGTHVSVEPFHLFRYLDEQAFRFNNRMGLNDADRFSLVIYGIVGRRVTYRELIAALNAEPSLN